MWFNSNISSEGDLYQGWDKYVYFWHFFGKTEIFVFLVYKTGNLRTFYF